MRRLLLVSLLIWISCPATADEPQRNRMKACNAEAATQKLKADARKQFMKNCLSTKKNTVEESKAVTPEGPPSATRGRILTAQQQRMKTCNADAKSRALSGEIRRQFMKDCLAKR